MRNDPLISIGQVAKRSGIAVSAIRYYADQKLIPSHRGNGGQRLFHRSVLRRVSFILIAQQLGYTLSEIQDTLANLPENRTPTKADWDKLGRQFSKDLDNHIAKLQKLKESLSGCIGCGCLSLKNCNLYNPEDKIAVRGAGPRYLMGDSATNND